jgi:diguanylate cyclase (GGDEF)-like protein
MNKKIMITLSSVMAISVVIILGIIAPHFFLKDNYFIYQILLSSLFLSVISVLIYRKYMKLTQTKDQMSDSLSQNTNELKQSLIYQERLNSILYEVTLKINEDGIDKLSMLNFILSKAIEAIPDAEYGSVLIVNEQGLFNFVAAYGYDYDTLKTIVLKKEETFLWLATGGHTTATPLIIRNIDTYNLTLLAPETYERHSAIVETQAKSVISSPIFLDGQLYGILNIDSLSENAFSDKDLNLTRFLTTHISFILKNSQLLDKAFYLSRFDKLTNIYNRTYFEDVFYDFQSKCFSHNKKFTMIIMDLNYLKKINDTYGHILGDQTLRAFADGVKIHLKPSDVFARYGGDEFIALIDGATLEDTTQKFEKIAAYFDDVHVDYNNLLIPIQFSYGIAEAPGESMIMDILVKIADERMYAHKKFLKQNNQNNPRFQSIR